MRLPSEFLEFVVSAQPMFGKNPTGHQYLFFSSCMIDVTPDMVREFHREARARVFNNALHIAQYEMKLHAWKSEARYVRNGQTWIMLDHNKTVNIGDLECSDEASRLQDIPHFSVDVIMRAGP